MLGEDFILFSFEKFEDPAAALDKLKNFDKARLIPLPPEIDAGCGYALRIREKDLTKALAILEESDYDGIYLMERDKNERRIISSYVF